MSNKLLSKKDQESEPYRQHFEDDMDDFDVIDEEEENEKKETRLVVRFVPKAIDYIIVVA